MNYVFRLVILVLILKFAAVEEQTLITNSTLSNNADMSSLLYANSAENKSVINFGPVNLTKIQLLGGWTDVYFILMPIGCVIMSFQTVTLPALAGDQYDTHDGEVTCSYISHSSFMLTHAMFDTVC